MVALSPSSATSELLRVAGYESSAKKELDWQRDWFRGGADTAGPLDLSAFDLEAAVQTWAALLGEAA